MKRCIQRRNALTIFYHWLCYHYLALYMPFSVTIIFFIDVSSDCWCCVIYDLDSGHPAVVLLTQMRRAIHIPRIIPTYLDRDDELSLKYFNGILRVSHWVLFSNHRLAKMNTYTFWDVFVWKILPCTSERWWNSLPAQCG